MSEATPEDPEAEEEPHVQMDLGGLGGISLWDVAPVQFRQISASDAVICGITLIGSDLRCWGAVTSPNTAATSNKMKYVSHLLPSQPFDAIPSYFPGPFRQVQRRSTYVYANPIV